MNTIRPLAAVVVFVLALAIAAGCGGGKLVDDEPRSSTGNRTGTSGANTGSSGTGGATSNGSGSAAVITERVEAPQAAPDVSTAQLSYNNAEVRVLLSTIRDLFSDGEYKDAIEVIAKAEGYVPCAAELDTQLAALKAKVLVYAASFDNVEPLSVKEKLWRLTFPNGAYIEGYILEESTQNNTMLIKRATPPRHFERIHLREVEKREPIRTTEQRAIQDEEYLNLLADFEAAQAQATAFDYYKFAQVTWRYNRPREARQYLAEAFAIDPDIAETVRLEHDLLYRDFLNASAQGDLQTARALLSQLVARYPRAELFKQAALTVLEASGNSSASTDSLTSTAERGAVVEEVLDEAETGASALSGGSQVSTGGVFGDELQSSDPNALEDSGDRYYELALAHDRKAMPGMDGFDGQLELALANYGFALELYERALRQGGPVRLEEKLTNVRRGMFWCRKRQPIR